MATGYGGGDRGSAPTGVPSAPTGIWRSTAARYALLPLRVFLGATFVYAGTDKLTSPAFFTDGAAGSLVAALNGVRARAAVPGLVDLALSNPHAVGYAIALGEVAVGLGTLLGLLARIAALGGALISLAFWLTVNWPTRAYHYGNDLVFLMAWLPLVLAGAPRLSLDALITRQRTASAPAAGSAGAVRSG